MGTFYFVEALDGPHEGVEITDAGVNIFGRLDMGSSVCPRVSGLDF